MQNERCGAHFVGRPTIYLHRRRGRQCKNYFDFIVKFCVRKVLEIVASYTSAHKK